jgi:hypothetical protein
MTDKPIPFFAIHRNNDGTWSVLDKRAGIRLLKAGFTSHAEAKQWVEDWHLKHGKMKSKPNERDNAPLAR